MRKNSIRVTTLLLGTVVGIVGGMLLAPSSGNDARKVLGYKVRNYLARLQELIQTLSYTKAVVSSQAKAASQEVIDATISKAQQLLQDANELAAQLE